MDTRPIQKGPDQFERVLPAESVSVQEIYQALSGFVRRQFLIFLLILGCAGVFAAIYLFTTPPQYTAHVMLLIDSSKMRFLQETKTPLGDAPLDTAQVETQVEVLKSDNIALSVIKEHKLTENSEFMNAGSGLVGATIRLISGLLASPEPESDLSSTRSALAIFKSNRAVTRVSRTYVMDIAYTASSPGAAAFFADAIADAYVVDQLESKFQATKRAGGWLQQRISELRQQVSVADLAVIEYKEKNKIVDVGSSSAVGGTGAKLLGDQQLAELTSQLVTARAATAEAKAKLDRIQDVIKQGLPDAAVTDSLKNEVINGLRAKYLEYAGRQAIWTQRYGANHLATINLRNQLAEIVRSISNELGRIAESYKSDYEIAKAREESMDQNFAKLVTASQTTNRDRLGLRELESAAQVNHTIYESFLQRYMEAIQQQSFPITEARVISPAAAPSQKSAPRPLLVFAIAGSIGLALSFAAALLREAMDRVFRTTRQVEEVLGTICLAVLPLLKKTAVTSRGVNVSGKAQASLAKDDPGRKIGFAQHELLRQVVNEPLSAFAEAFRSIKVAVDINGAIRANNVIGVTSTFPGEGKSTMASNLAALIAHAGKPVILLDADLRNPTLTRALAPKAANGLLQVLGNKIDLQQALYTDAATNLVFLPAVVPSRLVHTNEILASESFKQFLTGLRQFYDYIVVDLPPIAPVVDVRATANAIDSFVFAIEWGQTPISAVQHKLIGAPEIYDRLLGVVLNKANVNVLDRYEYYKGSKYYAGYSYTKK